MSAVSHCRSCGAEIIWGVLAVTGRRMPLDAEPTENGNCSIDAEGAIRVHTGTELSMIRSLGTPLHVSHFATCKHASEWRSGK